MDLDFVDVLLQFIEDDEIQDNSNCTACRQV